jgi:glycosyltransferase involved in cell wall biosynthesis
VRSYKGLDTVIEALGLLPPERRPAVRWAGALEIDAGPLLERARRLGVESHLELLGWVSDPRLEELLRGAAMTLNPSRYEGYGLSVAHSLARGLPTIASDIPAHRELAADAAAWFAPGDARALASVLDRLHDDADALARLGRRAAERGAWLAAHRRGWGAAVLDAVAALT